MIITKARTIQITVNLPENLWPEISKATGAPTKQLDWKSPLEALQVHLGTPNPKPHIAHLKIYGCRAYPLLHKIPKTRNLQPRAQIG